MNRIQLGRTGIEVSDICLGTMTFGTQTPEADAHTQIDMALDAGIDFLDTAEMYPVNPVLAETVGKTEKIIGNWNAKSGKRDKMIIATKHSGENGRFVRPGQDISATTVRETLDASLRRLQTDYVDLYQFHWPNRGSFMFRQNWDFDPRKQHDRARTLDNMAEVMEVLADLVKEGKMRAFGLSNDSAWGTMNWLNAAEKIGGPRVATMQNEYSLLCRLYDTDMAELSHHEDVTLLAFSPLACGFLTGKYRGGTIPDGSRMSIGSTMGGRNSPRVAGAVDIYAAIAEEFNIDLTHMALQWCRTRPFPTIPIVGATTTEQLSHNLKASSHALPEELLAEVSKAHRSYPMPY